MHVETRMLLQAFPDLAKTGLLIEFVHCKKIY
jgi:hypothetical protein